MPYGAIVNLVSLDHVAYVHLVDQVAVDDRDTLRDVQKWCLRTPVSLVPQNTLVVMSNRLLIPAPFLSLVFSFLSASSIIALLNWTLFWNCVLHICS